MAMATPLHCSSGGGGMLQNALSLDAGSWWVPGDGKGFRGTWKSCHENDPNLPSAAESSLPRLMQVFYLVVESEQPPAAWCRFTQT